MLLLRTPELGLRVRTRGSASQFGIGLRTQASDLDDGVPEADALLERTCDAALQPALICLCEPSQQLLLCHSHEALPALLPVTRFQHALASGRDVLRGG
eukprot:1244930-Rhodomonas_salina.1